MKETIKKAKRGIFLAITMVAFFGVLLTFFNFFAYGYLDNIFSFTNELRVLQVNDQNIDNELSNHSLLLYRNYTEINKLIRTQENYLEKNIVSDVVLAERHLKTKKRLQEYQTIFYQKKKNIEQFKILNSEIRKTFFELNKFLTKEKSYLFYKQPRLFSLLMEVNSLTYLCRTACSSKVHDDLSEKSKQLSTLPVADKKAKYIRKTFMSYSSKLISFNQQYQTLYKKLTGKASEKKLQQIVDVFRKEKEDYGKILPVFSVFFMLGLSTAVGFLIYFMLYSEKDKRELARLQKKLEYIAYYNPLTSLRNRNALKMELSRWKKPACLLINIDGFKHINDFYGISAGDSILKNYSRFLENVVPDICPRALAYHLGADEFAVIFDEVYVPDSNFDKQIAEMILHTTQTNKFYYNEIEIPIRVSIGISKGDQLLEKADMVLKYIKKQTRLPYLEYQEGLNLQFVIESNLKTVQLIKDSLELDRLVPFFQPIIDNETEEVYRYECLARIEKQNGTYSLPADFFKIVKETHYYREITIRMIEKSIEKFYDLEMSFSVNISVEDIMDYQINQYIEDLFSRYPGVAEQLTFEILESEQIHDYKRVEYFMNRMKNYGCTFAIDDFGSGYSSFSHLLGLHVDYLKIDGSLIRNIHIDDNAYLVVKMIVEFSNITGMKTIAEHVHSQEVYNMVKEMGINYSQGFYFRKPEPVL